MHQTKYVGFQVTLVIFAWILSQSYVGAEIACHAAPDAGSAAIDMRAEPSRRSNIVDSILPGPNINIAKLDTQSRTDGDWLLVEHGAIKGWVKADRLICNVAPEDAREIISPLCSRVLRALQSRDMNSLSQLVHPIKGVRFSPYAFLDSNANVRFTAASIRKAFADQRKRVWGAYDGSGDPIRLSFPEYYKRFVYDRDFAGTAEISYNSEAAFRGNTHDNSRQEYPNSIIVEAYVPGSGDRLEGEVRKGSDSRREGLCGKSPENVKGRAHRAEIVKTAGKPPIDWERIIAVIEKHHRPTRGQLVSSDEGRLMATPLQPQNCRAGLGRAECGFRSALPSARKVRQGYHRPTTWNIRLSIVPT